MHICCRWARVLTVTLSLVCLVHDVQVFCSLAALKSLAVDTESSLSSLGSVRSNLTHVAALCLGAVSASLHVLERLEFWVIVVVVLRLSLALCLRLELAEVGQPQLPKYLECCYELVCSVQLLGNYPKDRTKTP